MHGSAFCFAGQLATFDGLASAARVAELVSSAKPCRGSVVRVVNLLAPKECADVVLFPVLCLPTSARPGTTLQLRNQFFAGAPLEVTQGSDSGSLQLGSTRQDYWRVRHHDVSVS